MTQHARFEWLDWREAKLAFGSWMLVLGGGCVSSSVILKDALNERTTDAGRNPKRSAFTLKGKSTSKPLLAIHQASWPATQLVAQRAGCGVSSRVAPTIALPTSRKIRDMAGGFCFAEPFAVVCGGLR